MQPDSRSSSTASPPPAEAGDDSDFYAQPNDSQTSILVGGAVGKGGSGDVTVASAAPYAELDFDLTPIHRLPNEILMHIFGKFDSPKDIFTCMLVCKRWARHSVDLLWHRPVCTNLDDLAAICQVLNKDYPFFSYRTFVRRLNLSNLSSCVNDGTLVPLSVCSRLERLTLTNCTPITDHGLVQMVRNTPSLLALDVSQASSITGESINAIAETCRRLQGLNITNCINVSNQSLTNLAHNCRFIKRLKLNGCHQVTNDTVTTFAEKCPNMLEIDLTGCVGIGNAPITALLTHGQALRELRLASCELIHDEAFLNLPPTRTFAHLRILDLTSCVLLSDLAVQKIVSAAPRLRNLVLGKCRNLTDNAVYAISRLGKNLHYLHLGHCNNITDDGVKKLVQECTRIRYIDLGCCAHLTDDSITQLASLPKLKRIGLVKCLKITDECVKALARRKPRDHYVSSSSLERVHLSYCTALNLESIYILLNSCPKLTHLSLTGVTAFQHEKFARYCRQPPPEFNDLQREMFCVFSGHGVARFRECLNTDPEFDYLKDAFIEHQRSQIPPPWSTATMEGSFQSAHTRFLAARPMMGFSSRDGVLPMLPFRHGPPFYPSLAESAHGVGIPPSMMYYAPSATTGQGPAGSAEPGAFQQANAPFAQGATTAGPSAEWLHQWNLHNAANASPAAAASRLAAQDQELAGMENMAHVPGFRRPRASTATGVVRWPDGGTLDAAEGSSSGEQTVVAAPTAIPSASLAAGDDADAEDEDDDMRGGAHL